MVNQFDKVRGKPQLPILVLKSHADSMVRLWLIFGTAEAVPFQNIDFLGG